MFRMGAKTSLGAAAQLLEVWTYIHKTSSQSWLLWHYTTTGLTNQILGKIKKIKSPPSSRNSRMNQNVPCHCRGPTTCDIYGRWTHSRHYTTYIIHMIWYEQKGYNLQMRIIWYVQVCIRTNKGPRSRSSLCIYHTAARKLSPAWIQRRTGQRTGHPANRKLWRSWFFVGGALLTEGRWSGVWVERWGGAEACLWGRCSILDSRFSILASTFFFFKLFFYGFP